MPEQRRLRVDLFCEDAAHEDFARAVVARCAREEQVAVTLRAVSARFGIGRMKGELRAFQETVRRGAVPMPDVLVVLIDANRAGVARRREEVLEITDPAVIATVVIGVPEPYVERWLLADPISFAARFATEPGVGHVPDRTDWKQRLTAALESSGEIVLQGGAEFAEDIVGVMDLYRAGRAAHHSVASSMTCAARSGCSLTPLPAAEMLGTGSGTDVRWEGVFGPRSLYGNGQGRGDSVSEEP